jgi:hypothetical protein
MRNFIASIAVLALAIGAYYWYSGSPLPAQVAEITSDQQRVPSFEWRFESAGENEQISAPLTRVTLVANGTMYEVGTFTGSCSELKQEQLTEGELTAALCWWAGAGDELGVFQVDKKFVLKRGEQQEPTAETAPFRGNFTTLVEIAQ